MQDDDFLNLVSAETTPREVGQLAAEDYCAFVGHTAEITMPCPDWP